MRIPLRAGRLLDDARSGARSDRVMRQRGRGATVLARRRAGRRLRPVQRARRIALPGHRRRRRRPQRRSRQADGAGGLSAADAIPTLNPIQVVVRSPLSARDAAARDPARNPRCRSGNSRSTAWPRCTTSSALGVARTRRIVDDGVLRAGGVADGDARRLRRGLLRGAAADRRDRHAHGPRRHQPRRAGAHRRRRPEDGGHRRRRRRGRRDVAGVWLLVRVFGVGDIGVAAVRGLHGDRRAVTAVASFFRPGGRRGCRRWSRSGTSRIDVARRTAQSLRRAAAGISRAGVGRRRARGIESADHRVRRGVARGTRLRSICVALATLRERLGAMGAAAGAERGPTEPRHRRSQRGSANCSLPARRIPAESPASLLAAAAVSAGRSRRPGGAGRGASPEQSPRFARSRTRARGWPFRCGRSDEIARRRAARRSRRTRQL